MKNLVSTILFLFCSLIFAQTSSISISKSLSFEFNDTNVYMEYLVNDYSLSNSNNLSISFLDYSIDEDFRWLLFISSSTDAEIYNIRDEKYEKVEFNGSIILEEEEIFKLKEQIDIIYSYRKNKNFSSSYNSDSRYEFNYSLTNGIVSMYIPNNAIMPEIYNNGLLNKYKNVEGIYFKLNAEEIKQFRKFLKGFSY